MLTLWNIVDWSPLWVTTKLALVTTLVLSVITIPLAYWLAFSKSRWRSVVEAVVSLPLVLPPTVLGFYLLMVFSPGNFFGKWILETFGLQLAFSFTGLVIGSIVYSLPFMVNPILTGLLAVPQSLSEASYMLGKSKMYTFVKVVLPNIQKSIFTGAILTFAHTIGEFGVVLMIGGSIPNETKVVSIAIYEEVEAMNYNVAHTYSVILFISAFLILLMINLLNKGYLKKFLK